MKGKKITTILRSEHRQSLSKIADFEEGIYNLSADPNSTVDRLLVINTANFIEEQIALHFRQEEQFFFPLLERLSGMREGPLKMMRYEHEEFRRYNRYFQEFIEQIRFANDIAPFVDELLEIGKVIILLMREHIFKENNVLFPMAEKLIATDELVGAGQKIKNLSQLMPELAKS